MRTAIDTNAISTVWSVDPRSGKVATILSESHDAGGLVIAAPVYAELLAHPRATIGFVDSFLASTGVYVDFRLDEDVWREAGLRFAKYATRRRVSRAGQPKRLPADFLIGAHALLRADCLLTLDAARFAQDFSELTIITCRE